MRFSIVWGWAVMWAWAIMRSITIFHGMVKYFQDKVPHLDNSSDVHFCNHLCWEHERDEKVNAKGHKYQTWVKVECFGCVHADWDNTEQGTDAEHPSHPVLVHPLYVSIVIEVLIRTKVRQVLDIPASALLPGQHGRTVASSLHQEMIHCAWKYKTCRSVNNKLYISINYTELGYISINYYILSMDQINQN